ncbi:MAG: type II toxin-antitoxin system PemK/MazF family toxin [Microbacterium sp.]
MATRNGYLNGLAKGIANLLFPGTRISAGKRAKDAGVRPPTRSTARSAGQSGATATTEIAPPTALRIAYAPSRDGDPDAGEIVWTWVPYEEDDGRGKDRPVLVIAVHSAERVFAVRLTSTPHGGDRDFVEIGSGAWDSQGRPSWVDISQLYSVHRDGMRREAAELDLTRFARVARALQKRYGWAVGD